MEQMTQLMVRRLTDEANGSGRRSKTLVEQMSELSHAELARSSGWMTTSLHRRARRPVSVAYVIVTKAPETPHASPPPPSPPPYRSSGGSWRPASSRSIVGVPVHPDGVGAGRRAVVGSPLGQTPRRRVACLSRTAPSGVAPTLAGRGGANARRVFCSFVVPCVVEVSRRLIHLSNVCACPLLCCMTYSHAK